MIQPKEMIGHKFNRLTVIKFVGRNKFKQRIYSCICDCQNICLTTGANLRSGKTKSCGCYKLEVLTKNRKASCEHKEKPYYAKGLCDSCYQARQRERRTDLQKNRLHQKQHEWWIKYNSIPLVYVYMALDGRADYVGRGNNDRVIRHRTKSGWWAPEHIILSMTCNSEWQAMEYEGKWGAFYKPRYNKEGYRYGTL